MWNVRGSGIGRLNQLQVYSAEDLHTSLFRASKISTRVSLLYTTHYTVLAFMFLTAAEAPGVCVTEPQSYGCFASARCLIARPEWRIWKALNINIIDKIKCVVNYVNAL